MAPITVTPVSTRSTRRKRALPESPDQADARPPLRSRSPDLGSPFTLSRPPNRQAREDDYPLQLLARTAANHSNASFVPILPRTYRPMRPPVAYRPTHTADQGSRTDTIVVDPKSPKSTARSQSAQSGDKVGIPPRDDPSPLPTSKRRDDDETANIGTAKDKAADNDFADHNMADSDMADSDMVGNDMANDDTANNDMANEDVADKDLSNGDMAGAGVASKGMANGNVTNGGDCTDTKRAETVLVEDIPQPRTSTPSASRTAKPRVDSVFARLRNERELEIADLEGEVQKVRYEINVKKTQIQLYRHNHMQAQRRAERIRGSLSGLVAEEEGLGQVGEYDKALAEIAAIGERYPSIFDAQDEENPGEPRKQTPCTPAKRSLSQTSSLGMPGVQDVGGTPRVLLSSLHASIKMQKAQRMERKTAAHEARVAAEQNLQAAEAAAAESLVETEDAEASVANLLGSLESLEKYLNSVKEQAELLNKMGTC
ncbi:hypothetical protein LY78DRAFT_663856 [Colletotrichum sublineola]|nr:hypothetical protein LY78DRAFT_663856 [Colletotrichum sublineola]